MAGTTEQGGGGRRWNALRIAAWSAAGGVLLFPLIAMQFTSEVNWTLSDFVFAGLLIGVVGLALELTVRRSGDPAYRLGAGAALAAGFLLIWISGAVGIIGNEDEAPNLLFFGVLATALLGALAARFRAGGMARAMLAAGLVQAAIGLAALIRGWGASGPIWPADVLGLTGFFTALWLTSAWLFRQAGRS